MKTRSTKKALLASLLSLVVCVSMLVGSTFAWFTDSVTSAQNVIQSGNLDVELYYTYDAAVAADADSTAWKPVTSSTDIYGYDLWEPGYTKVAYFKVVNEGSLALKYKLSADVYAETAGKNQKGESFLLSDYIKTALIPVGATRDQILAMAGTDLKASFGMSAEHLTAEGTANDTKVVGMALWMPTTVGNEANHDGVNVPKITFGINLVATQDTVEIDSFGSDYDVNAVYPNINFPSIVTGNANVETGATSYEVKLNSSEINLDTGKYSEQGSVIVPAEAVADDADQIEVVIKKLDTVDTTVPGASTSNAITIDISIEGIKADNTAPIKITTNIGAGLGDIELYHKNQKIPFISYDNNTGVLIFESATFSPFTIVNVEDAPTTESVPQAIVKNVTNAITDYNMIDASGLVGSPSVAEGQKLDVLYQFQAPALIAGNIYNDWACDFYVRYECDGVTTLPENSVVLGGQYEAFSTDWFAFTNPEVDAGYDIPLLGSVAKIDWTYERIANEVGTFNCGVGVVKQADGTALNKGKFVVMLRLTDPETGKYINVCTVTYDFATETSTTKTDSTLQTPVSTGQELQDAVNNGDGYIVLEGDIDLSNGGIVIP